VSNHPLATITIAALAARLAVTFTVADVNKVFEYQLIAENMLQGKGMSWNEWGRVPLSPTSLFPPLYIYWCRLFIMIFGQNFLFMNIAQAIVAASGCIPAWLVGERMFDRKTGTVFALLFALYPEMAFLHSRNTPEFVYVVFALWVIFIYLVLRNSELIAKRTIFVSVGFGLLAGAGILIREGVLVVAGAAMLSLVIHRRPVSLVWRRIVLPAALAGILMLTPWTVRNFIVQGRFIPIRTAYGMNLWMGNHDKATGTDKTYDGGYQMNLLWAEHADYYRQSMPADEQERSAFYRHEALRFIQAHPWHYLKLTARRLYYFVWFDPTHPLARNLIYRSSYVIALLMGIPGIMLAARRRKIDSVLLISFFGFIALYVPVIILPRYRIIPMLFLLLMASYAAVSLWDWRQKQRATSAV